MLQKVEKGDETQTRLLISLYQQVFRNSEEVLGKSIRNMKLTSTSKAGFKEILDCSRQGKVGGYMSDGYGMLLLEGINTQMDCKCMNCTTAIDENSWMVFKKCFAVDDLRFNVVSSHELNKTY